MYRFGFICLILAGSAGSVSCQRAGGSDGAERPQAKPAPKRQLRPARWAQPVKVKGLPNLHKVTDTLYRGAQPEDEGFAQLKALGIKTVINLRTFHSDRKDCEKAGLEYVHITVQAWEGEVDEVVEFLKVATDAKRQPLFVHCLHGADRTGTMCAVYRMAVQGWSKDEAIREMTEGKFGFHGVWTNLVRFLRGLDLTAVKQRAGLSPKIAR